MFRSKLDRQIERMSQATDVCWLQGKGEDELPRSQRDEEYDYIPGNLLNASKNGGQGNFGGHLSDLLRIQFAEFPLDLRKAIKPVIAYLEIGEPLLEPDILGSTHFSKIATKT